MGREGPDEDAARQGQQKSPLCDHQDIEGSEDDIAAARCDMDDRRDERRVENDLGVQEVLAGRVAAYVGVPHRSQRDRHRDDEQEGRNTRGLRWSGEPGHHHADENPGRQGHAA